MRGDMLDIMIEGRDEKDAAKGILDTMNKAGL